MYDRRHGATPSRRCVRCPRHHPPTGRDLRSALRPPRRPRRRSGRQHRPLGGRAARTPLRAGRPARPERGAARGRHQDRLGCAARAGRHHARHRETGRHRPSGPDRGTAEIGAGTPLRAVQAILERTGRRLALDAPHRAWRRTRPARCGTGTAPPATSSSACATWPPTVSWPRRVVQAVPAARVWVTRPVWTPLEVHDLIQAVLAARLDPAAIELDLPVGPVAGPGGTAAPSRWRCTRR